MTIENAVKKAIEGGFDPYKNVGDFWMLAGTGDGSLKRMADGWNVPVERILLDPTFWQSLGKYLGWSVCQNAQHIVFTNDEGGAVVCPECPRDDMWLEYWEQLILHVAQGGTPEQFFATLK
ncbi:MAG: hypothetical protein KGL39_14935 [Patescibacteria group bacterium]|nr:hypothetical protein [Patescibacteria group bacterium]